MPIAIIIITRLRYCIPTTTNIMYVKILLLIQFIHCATLLSLTYNTVYYTCMPGIDLLKKIEDTYILFISSV